MNRTQLYDLHKNALDYVGKRLFASVAATRAHLTGRPVRQSVKMHPAKITEADAQKFLQRQQAALRNNQVRSFDQSVWWQRCSNAKISR